jgi:MFS family permease
LAPQYATFLGYKDSDGAALLSVMSGMNSVSRITMGFLADRLGKLNTMFVCSLAAGNKNMVDFYMPTRLFFINPFDFWWLGIFTSVIWQFSSGYGTYVAFCVLYGLTGGAFVSLLPVVIADIVGVKNIQRGIGMCYTVRFFFFSHFPIFPNSLTRFFNNDRSLYLVVYLVSLNNKTIIVE